MSTSSKRQEVDRNYKDGLEKHFKGSKAISFLGTDYKPGDLSIVFQDNIDAWNARNEAKLAYRNATKAAEASEKKTALIRSGLRAYVIALYGDGNPALSDFGIEPKKTRRKLTTEEKQTAVDKMKATRKARRTIVEPPAVTNGSGTTHSVS
jgi:hypothetical protein